MFYQTLTILRDLIGSQRLFSFSNTSKNWKKNPLTIRGMFQLNRVPLKKRENIIFEPKYIKWADIKELIHCYIDSGHKEATIVWNGGSKFTNKM